MSGLFISMALVGTAVVCGIGLSLACLAGFFEVCDWLLDKNNNLTLRLKVNGQSRTLRT